MSQAQGAVPERAPSQVQGMGSLTAPPEHLMGEFTNEINRLRQENAEIRYQKELKERDFESVMFENTTLQTKLDNLENVFIGAPLQKPDGQGKEQFAADYQTSTLVLENNELRRKIGGLEQENIDMKIAL